MEKEESDSLDGEISAYKLTMAASIVRMSIVCLVKINKHLRW